MSVEAFFFCCFIIIIVSYLDALPRLNLLYFSSQKHCLKICIDTSINT